MHVSSSQVQLLCVPQVFEINVAAPDFYLLGLGQYIVGLFAHPWTCTHSHTHNYRSARKEPKETALCYEK